MKVSIHKGVELMNALMLVSDSEFVRKFPSVFAGDKKYIENIHKFFNNYKNDEIICQFRNLNFGFNAVSYGYVLNDNYELDNNKDISNINENIRSFLEKLQRFAKKINFDTFIQQNQDFYQEIIQEYSNLLIKSNYENFMKWFYKEDLKLNDNREFVLMPTLFQIGMCLQNGRACCASVQEIDKNGKSYFVSKEMKESFVPYTAIHEFSHPIVDLLTHKYFENNEKFSIDNIETKSAGAYKNEGVINDTIIEAIVGICLEKLGLTEYKEQRIKAREKVGFYLIEPLIEFLKSYIENINDYNSFSKFFPQVMIFLREESKKVEGEKI